MACTRVSTTTKCSFTPFDILGFRASGRREAESLHMRLRSRWGLNYRLGALELALLVNLTQWEYCILM
jgi:hypothetical protein